MVQYNFFGNFVETENSYDYYDFHCVQVATKLLTAKLHSLYVEES